MFEFLCFGQTTMSSLVVIARMSPDIPFCDLSSAQRNCLSPSFTAILSLLDAIILHSSYFYRNLENFVG